MVHARALALCVLAAGCAKQPSAPQAATPSPSPRPTPTAVAFHVTSSGQGGRRVVLTERRLGRIVYVLHADENVSNRFAAGTGRSVFTRPHIVFYQDQGKSLTADSPSATVEEQTKTVLMSGGVHAHTQDGITLTCDTLQYDDRSEMLHGKGNVVVETPRGSTAIRWTLTSTSTTFG
jgi:LPS export ABC transporter protein LptC